MLLKVCLVLVRRLVVAHLSSAPSATAGAAAAAVFSIQYELLPSCLIVPALIPQVPLWLRS
jgi:uncharacterized membrane protein YjjB (DUF3815 family)